MFIMGALAKLFSYPDRIVSAFFHKTLPLIILSICVVRKYYRLTSSNYKYTSMIDQKSSKFLYCKEMRPELAQCRICLSEFEAGDKCRELVDCKHAFHRNCVEKWLKGYRGRATCPMCRSIVVPDEIVAEYHLMQIEQENDGFEQELALILLNSLHNGICNGIF